MSVFHDIQNCKNCMKQYCNICSGEDTRQNFCCKECEDEYKNDEIHRQILERKEDYKND